MDVKQWTVFRIVRKRTSFSTSDLPVIEVLSQNAFIFLDHPNKCSQTLNANDLMLSPTYAVLSQNELIIFLITTVITPTVTCSIRWGSSPQDISVVYAPEPTQLQVLNPIQDSVYEIPIVHQGLPPIASHKGPWLAIEVHTIIQHQTLPLKMRLEHNSEFRVPYSPWWKKSEAVKRCGGYASVPAPILKRQANAAFTWMYASFCTLQHSGWAKAMSDKNLGRFYLMGFETNNPFHDDHEGKGAHWHLAVRDPAPPAENVTPHLYLNAEGGLRKREEQFGTYLYNLGVCYLTVNSHNGIDLDPIIRLKSARSGNYLHTSNDPREEKGELIQSNNSDKGTYWVLRRVSAKSQILYKLQSVQNHKYLHVRMTLQKDRDPVVQYGPEEDDGSLWKLRQENGVYLLQNWRSDSFLHVRQSKQNIGDPVAQWHQEHNDGNHWIMEILCDSLDHYSLVPEPTMNDFKVVVKKNEEELFRVAAYDNAEEGILEVKTNSQAGSTRIKYNPLTGKIENEVLLQGLDNNNNA